MLIRHFLILFFICFIISVKAINFEQFTIEQSLTHAKKENRFILVSYTASWCLPCQYFKLNAYLDYNVNDIVSKTMIPVQVNYDDHNQSKWLEKYNVTHLPTHLILDAYGNEIARAEGGMSTQKFLTFLIKKSSIKNETNDDPRFTQINIANDDSKSMEGKIYVDGILVDAVQNNSYKTQPISSSFNEDIKPQDNNSSPKIIVDGVLVDIPSIVNTNTNVESKPIFTKENIGLAVKTEIKSDTIPIPINKEALIAIPSPEVIEIKTIDSALIKVVGDTFSLTSRKETEVKNQKVVMASIDSTEKEKVMIAPIDTIKKQKVVIVPIDSTKNQKTVTNDVNKVSTVADNLDIEPTKLFAIQFGAFPTLEKALIHKKMTAAKLNQEMMIYEDHAIPKLPFKVISKERYDELNAMTLKETIRKKGIDCFVKELKK